MRDHEREQRENTPVAGNGWMERHPRTVGGGKKQQKAVVTDVARPTVTSGKEAQRTPRTKGGVSEDVERIHEDRDSKDGFACDFTSVCQHRLPEFLPVRTEPPLEPSGAELRFTELQIQHHTSNKQEQFFYFLPEV